MNRAQRELIIERDLFSCANCRIVGEVCPERGTGEPCKLLSPTLNRVTYFKLEATRHPLSRLQVDHLIGRSQAGVEVTEAYEHCWTLCPCCHRSKSAAMKARGLAYAAQFAGAEPQDYLAALAEEAAGFDAKRTKKAKARRASYKKTKAKAGGSPLSKLKGKSTALKAMPKSVSSKLPEKVRLQNDRPVLNGGSIS